MNTNNKTLAQEVNEILRSRMSANKKAAALVKIGVTADEATFLAKASIPATPRARRTTFAYTFGVEIETINCPRQRFYEAARQAGLDVYEQHYYNHDDMPKFKLVPDSSLSGYDTNECVTPALQGNGAGFASLKACCGALKAIGAGVNQTCGLHVHIGAANLTEQEYCNVFYNYQRLEAAIDTFMAYSRRQSRSRWCRSLRLLNLEDCEQRRSVYAACNGDRYYKVNPCSWSRHKTIEFRQHQGTVNYTKIAAWVKFLGKLVAWSKDNRLAEQVNRIEDIPFLTAAEKRYFIGRREALAETAL